jgi:hypothetical protein
MNFKVILSDSSFHKMNKNHWGFHGNDIESVDQFGENWHLNSIESWNSQTWHIPPFVYGLQNFILFLCTGLAYLLIYSYIFYVSIQLKFFLF